MSSFKYFFFSGLVALFHGSLAEPSDMQNALFSSFMKPINGMLNNIRHTRDLFSPNENYDETYQLKVNSSVLCLNSPIELEWTASPDHNSQVSDIRMALKKCELIKAVTCGKKDYVALYRAGESDFFSVKELGPESRLLTHGRVVCDRPGEFPR